MKSTTKKLSKLISLMLMVLCTVEYSGYAQKADKDKIKNIIDAKNFTFRAQSAIPQRGSTIFLTSEYDLRVSKDTITAFLPYYGQAFSAPVDPTKGGIKFTATEFTYVVEHKKRGWSITITPKNVRDSDVRYMLLNISDDGYGSLRVFSNNRDGITFSGHIISTQER